MAGSVLSFKNMILEERLEFAAGWMDSVLRVRSRAGVQRAAGPVAVGVERNKEAEILAAATHSRSNRDLGFCSCSWKEFHMQLPYVLNHLQLCTNPNTE